MENSRGGKIGRVEVAVPAGFRGNAEYSIRNGMLWDNNYDQLARVGGDATQQNKGGFVIHVRRVTDMPRQKGNEWVVGNAN